MSKAYASDIRTTPRGPVGTDVKMDLWFPPEFHPREEAFKAQKDDGIKRVHPISIYTVATAKRRGRLRTCAVPLDPEKYYVEDVTSVLADYQTLILRVIDELVEGSFAVMKEFGDKYTRD